MKLYVVQNQEGRYFRSSGYGGVGKKWRENLAEAKFYTHLGAARGQVTFWYKNFPQYGKPRILAFTLTDENKEIVE